MPSSIDLTSDSGSSSLSCKSPSKKKQRDDESDVDISVSSLYTIFSSVSRTIVDSILAIVGNASIAMDILLGEVDINALVPVVRRVQLKGCSSFITVDSEDVVTAALMYYKKPSLDMTRPIHIVYKGSTAIDAGGLKRQFFCDVLLRLRDSFSLFEGSNNRLLPCYTPSAITSGLLRVLGCIVVHSVLQDGPGFPFLAPCIYKYICTESVEEAIQCVELHDLSEPFADFMSKVCTVIHTYPLIVIG